jgi:thioredoxin-dependent peroxiredoxin
MASVELAPDFVLQGIVENGEMKTFTLDELLSQGKYLVLYFYPKDDTPGCTTEACDFRDNIGELKKIAVVVGVSADTIESHQKFAKKFGLPFPLLSDPDKKIIIAYRAFGEKNLYGKLVPGIIRSTFIISPDKKIVKSWSRVSAKGHVAEVIVELKKLKKSAR